MSFKQGDRVKQVSKGSGPGRRTTRYGTVDKTVPPGAKAHAVVVVDWDDGTRSTEWDDCITAEDS